MGNYEFLNSVLDYDQSSGAFTYKNDYHIEPFRLKSAGRITSSKSYEKAYCVIEIQRESIKYKAKAHRLAWYAMTGHEPQRDEQIDHIDGNGTNNAFFNLRLVSPQENCRNVRLRADNQSGKPGVCFHKRVGKWYAKITVSGKAIHIGYFENKNLAIEAREKAEIKYGFHENHGSDRPKYLVKQYL